MWAFCFLLFICYCHVGEGFSRYGLVHGLMDGDLLFWRVARDFHEKLVSCDAGGHPLQGQTCAGRTSFVFLGDAIDESVGLSVA